MATNASDQLTSSVDWSEARVEAQLMISFHKLWAFHQYVAAVSEMHVIYSAILYTGAFIVVVFDLWIHVLKYWVLSLTVFLRSASVWTGIAVTRECWAIRSICSDVSTHLLLTDRSIAWSCQLWRHIVRWSFWSRLLLLGLHSQFISKIRNKQLLPDGISLNRWLLSTFQMVLNVAKSGGGLWAAATRHVLASTDSIRIRSDKVCACHLRGFQGKKHVNQEGPYRKVKTKAGSQKKITDMDLVVRGGVQRLNGVN